MERYLLLMNGLEDHIIKMAILLKLLHSCTAIFIKIPVLCFVVVAEKDKIILKFIMKCNRLQTAKTVLKSKNKVEELISLF